MNSSSLTSANDAAIESWISGFFVCYILFAVVIIAVSVYVYYKIIKKTGYSGWLALLSMVPLANIGLLLFLAFSDWPLERENQELRARLGYDVSGYPPGTGASGYAGYGPSYSPPSNQPPVAPPYPGGPETAQIPQVPAPQPPQAPQPPYQP
jgi:hypothetical protein